MSRCEKEVLAYPAVSLLNSSENTFTVTPIPGFGVNKRLTSLLFRE